MTIKSISILLYFLFIFSNPFFSFSNEKSSNEIGDNIISMFIGDKEAPVIIIEYASFTCPHCATFHNEVLPKIKTDYINNGKVLLEYREVYFDGPGLWAGLLARCQGSQKYFPMVDLIYKKQKDWASGNRDDIIKGLLSIGRQSGLTDEKSRQCMENSIMAEDLIKIFKKNATEDGISSTPSFIINGELIENMSYEELKKIIDKNLN
ncbi:MAG: DsbA family protein [Paracoccaceae bacterium]